MYTSDSDLIAFGGTFQQTLLTLESYINLDLLYSLTLTCHPLSHHPSKCGLLLPFKSLSCCRSCLRVLQLLHPFPMEVLESGQTTLHLSMPLYLIVSSLPLLLIPECF
jgi:hypothetical protein